MRRCADVPMWVPGFCCHAKFPALCFLRSRDHFHTLCSIECPALHAAMQLAHLIAIFRRVVRRPCCIICLERSSKLCWEGSGRGALFPFQMWFRFEVLLLASRGRGFFPSFTSSVHDMIPSSSLGPLGIPAPYLREIFAHVDLLRLELNHPRVLEHLPGHAAAFRVLLQTFHRC